MLNARNERHLSCLLRQVNSPELQPEGDGDLKKDEQGLSVEVRVKKNFKLA